MIDWKRVNDLRDEVGAEDFDEVVELFLEETDEAIERLKAALDHTTYEEDLHFLKGSALNLGFDAFAALCSEGEIKAGQGQADQIDLTPVFDFYATSKAQFISELQAKLAG